MNALCTAKTFAAGAAVTAGFVFLGCGSVSADAQTNTDAVFNGVRVSATCVSNVNDGQALWAVSNPSAEPVNLTWSTQAAGGHTGEYVAQAGDSVLKTGFEPTEADTAYVFSQDGQADQTVVASTDKCHEDSDNQNQNKQDHQDGDRHEDGHHHDDEATCVDGNNRDNMEFDWNQNGTVTLRTKDGALLCNDVTVFLSSYTLPATYSKSGIFDDSSLPQNIFDSTSAVLKAGTTGEVTLTITVPNVCTNYQLDLYYAPEITLVTGAGHGSQLIYGDITSATQEDCSQPTPVVTPPVVTPTAPQVLGTTTETPHILAAATVLPNTGANIKLPTILAAVITGAAILLTAVKPARKQQ